MKHRLTSYFVALSGLFVSLLPAIGNSANVICIANSQTNQAFQVIDNNSVPIPVTQAANTWDDWTWRGPEFYCTATGSDLCTYTWGKSQTIGYDFSVGGGFGDLGNIKLLGGTILSLFGLEGSYGYNRSWTETFTWSQQISGGYFAQPVMVVRRRWTSGVFKGTYYKTNSACSHGDGTGGNWNLDNGTPGFFYWWNPNATFGSWTGNLAVTKFGMYYVHK